MLTGTACTVTSQEADTPLPSLAVQVIVAMPAATAVTFPELSTVATLVLFDDHVTVLSVALSGFTVTPRVWLLPSSKFNVETSRMMSVTLTIGSVTVNLQYAVFPLSVVTLINV